ncbi:MAG: proprotein convertase P-domain-containing protein [Lewinellaceae bacterium]|nr:proprotein convertase P-domain-containing protein [Lewinellaceae bacterium]
MLSLQVLLLFLLRLLPVLPVVEAVGIQEICNPNISWHTTGVPCTGAFTGTQCGFNYNGGTYTITVNVPANVTGPMVVTLNTQSDGYGTAPFSDVDQVTFAQAVPAVPCEINCPADMTFNLAPGLCDIAVNYQVTTTGDCIGNVTGFQQGFAPSAINYFQNNQGIFTNPPTPHFNSVNSTFNATAPPTQLTIVDGDFSQGGITYYWMGDEWTNTTASAQNISFDWAYSTNDSPFWDRFYYKIGNAASNFSNSNFGNQTGVWTEVTNQNGPNAQNGSLALVIQPGQRLALAGYTLDGGGGPCTINITNFQQNAPAELVQTSGPASGDIFPIGTTEVCWKVDFSDPNTPDIDCCFNVTVNDYPNPITTLACNDLVQISLDASCSHCIGADEVLEGGPYSCYDNYIVQLDKTLPLGNGPWVPGCVGAADIGKTYAVRVTDPSTGNSCWGQVKIEDKLKPIVQCDDLTLPCNAPSTAVGATALFNLNTAPVAIADNATATGTVTVAGIPADAKVLDVNMTLDITHTWIGDLTIKLVSPDGIEMRLWGNNCGPTDNIKQRSTIRILIATMLVTTTPLAIPSCLLLACRHSLVT